MAKKQRGKVRHIRKFMDGRATPQEIHRAIGIRKNCVYCGRPAAIRIKVLIELGELTKRQPEYVAQIMVTNPNGPYVPTIPTIHGPMVKVSDVGACDLCRADAEKAAARGPSWAIVEIDRGPVEKTTVPVPSSLVS